MYSPQPQYDHERVYEADYRVREDGEVEPAKPRSTGWKTLFGPAGALMLFLITKFKFVLAIFKFKFLATGISALLSVGAYALVFPWQFAAGLVVLIFIHEMGHALVLRRYGVASTAPIFIPFMGAFIGMKQLPKNAVMEAYVGLGGPVIGSLGALGAFALYLATDSSIWLVLAYVGVLLNLFNLLPILPLDGGRAVGAISRWMWVVGYGAAIAFLLIRPSPILLLILLFGAGEVMNAIRGRGNADYYTVSRGDRLAVSLIYFGLILVLGFLLYELQPLVHESRPR
jgi:Zn-dependent protease